MTTRLPDKLRPKTRRVGWQEPQSQEQQIMRVKFSQSVAIDINQVQKSEYGKLIRVHPTIPPEFVPPSKEHPDGVIEAKQGAPEWHVRVGVAIDLPESLAEAFISAEVAELVTTDRDVQRVSRQQIEELDAAAAE